MFKAVKWGALIVMVMLVFLNKTAHAMFKMHQDKNPVSTEYESTQQQEMQTTVFITTSDSQNILEPENKINKEFTVKELDRKAKRWDYTDFNWVETYAYLFPYISSMEFIGATDSGYESIEYLAQALLKSAEFSTNTIDDTKFFVYSVLRAIYKDRIAKKKTRLPGFPFLLKVYKTMQPYKPEKVTVNPIQSQNDDIASALMPFFVDKFVSNPDISNFMLTNHLPDLIQIINTYANIYIQTELQLPANIPTVQQVLNYYPGEYDEVLSFLITYPFEFKRIKTFNGIKLIQSEKNLRQEVSKVFLQLWQEEPSDNLAKLAITVFGFNPLKNNSAAISQSDVYAVQQPTGSSFVDWNKFELDCYASFANDVVRWYYVLFMHILNLNLLMPHLLQKQVITCPHQQKLLTSMLENKAQNEIFLDIILTDSMYSFQPLKNLLEIMEVHGSIIEQGLARKIYFDLQLL